MGRRITSTTKGGKFMNPTDQARKEARRRELRKNKKQRMMVRQAVIKTKNPRQMVAELHTLDEMELDPSENLPYNDKVVKEKRIKLLENLDRIAQYYLKEDPDQGREIKRLVDNYRKDRIKKELYYESVRNAQRVKIETIPLPDTPFETPQLSEIPLPGIQPQSILKKPPMLTQPVMKTGPPGPPPGPPPAKKKYKGHDPVFHHPRPPPGPPPMSSQVDKDDDQEEEAYDPEDDPATLDEAHSDDEKSDEEFFHRDEDLDENLGAKQRKRRTSQDEEDYDDGDDDEAHYEERKRAKMSEMMSDEASGITPLQAMMLKLAGQEIPTNRPDPGTSEGEGDKKKQRKVAFTETPQNAPPGPPPGLPPGPPGLPPDIAVRHMQPGMLPPGPPPGHPPNLPPGPPPGLPPTMPMRMNLPPAMHQPSKVSGPSERYGGGQQMDNNPPSMHAGSSSSNVLSAPPSLIHRRQDMEKDGIPAMIVAKPKIINNPKADVTRFMPTSLRVKRQNHGKSSSNKSTPSTSSQQSFDRHRQERSKATGKINADAAYDSFMKEMQGFL